MLTRAQSQMALLFIAVVGLMLAAWWWVGAEPEAPQGPVAARGQGASPGAAGPRAGRVHSASGPAALEINVDGVQLDVSRLFDLGFAGGLTIDRETREILGALLMAMPEEPAPQDLEKLESALRQGLPKADADKAIKLFHGYRGYLGDMKVEVARMGIPDTPQAGHEYFDRLAQLQRRHFDDATAQALFGQENLNARLTMQASFINNNAGLSLSEKTAQLEALRAQLPADLRNLIPDPPAPEPAPERQ